MILMPQMKHTFDDSEKPADHGIDYMVLWPKSNENSKMWRYFTVYQSLYVYYWKIIFSVCRSLQNASPVKSLMYLAASVIISSRKLCSRLQAADGTEETAGTDYDGFETFLHRQDRKLCRQWPSFQCISKWHFVFLLIFISRYVLSYRNVCASSSFLSLR